MAELFNIISIISFALSGVFCIITIALFFIFRIPSVMGDLSGKNVKKSIDNMRKERASSYKKYETTISNNVDIAPATSDDSTEVLSNITEQLLEETTLLVNDEIQKIRFIYIVDEMIIHTNEVI